MVLKSCLLAALILILVPGCGRREPASPLSLLPDNPLVAVVVVEPVSAVRNIDGYVAAGAPLLGTGLVENALAEILGIEGMDDLSSVGLDPEGSIVFWMESMMPQSMAMAVSVSDFSGFLELLSRLGLDFQPGQALNGLEVYQAASENGTVYAAESRGVALLSMSRNRLSSMSEALAPAEAGEPGSLRFSMNIGMIGPMAASQLPMLARQTALEADMPGIAEDFIDLYFEATAAFLTQTLLGEARMVFSPDDVSIVQTVVFREGSDLAEMLVPPSTPSLLSRIPAGDVLSMQMRVPRRITTLLMEKLCEVTGLNLGPETTELWADMSSSAAMSIFREGHMSFIIAYQMPPGADLESVTLAMSEMTAEAMALLPSELDDTVMFSALEAVEVQGVSMKTFTFTLVPPETDEFPTDSMVFSYWYAQHDGLFLVESGEEPLRILSVVSGEYEPASGIEGLTGEGVFSYAMDIGGYFELIRQFSPDDIPLPDELPSLWVTGETWAEEGVLEFRTVVSGKELVYFISSIAMAAGI